MFYAHFVLASKGPLARIWLAAHWDKKLTKSHVFETNIESSVEGILQPKIKMALRTSGHLLLGIVRIYSRKAKYLLADCNEAYIKMRMAFRPGVVDLPEAAREAAVATITLPEVFHDFDSVPDIAIDFDNEVTLNQSRAEDITLKEDYGNLNLITEENFDAFDEQEGGRDGTTMDEGFENASMLTMMQAQASIEDKEGEDNSKDIMAQSNTSLSASKPSVSLSGAFRDDGFGGTVGVGLLEDGETGGLFEPAGLFDDAPLDNITVDNPEAPVEQPLEKPSGPLSAPPAPPEDNDSDDDMYDMGPGMSPGGPSGPSSPECENTEIAEPEKQVSEADNQMNSNPLVPEVTAPDILSPVPEVPPPPEAPPVMDHHISNEEETFALAPLDTTIVHGAERTVKTKRKRKLIVDDVKNISGEEMKSQLSDTTDIVVTLDLAPPTKRLMLWKESGGVEKLFALSGLRILSRRLSCQYQIHLSTRTQSDDFGNEDDLLHTLEELPRQKDESEDLGLNSAPARKRQRRDMNEPMYPDFAHLDNTPYLEKDSNYSTDHSLTHPPRAPSIDPNFLQEQMLMTSQHEMMGNVMQHPPPAHMMQMFPPNVPDQLVHLPDNLLPPHPAAMVNQGTPLSMSSAIPNISSPAVPDAFNPPRFMSPDKNMGSIVPALDSQQAHLLSHTDTLTNQTANQSPMHQFQDQLPHPNDSSSNIMENNVQPHPHILNQGPHVDEEATCLNEDYANTHNNTSVLPPTDALLSVTDKEPLDDRNFVNDIVNHAVNQEKSPLLSAFDQLAQQPSNNLTENSIVENPTAEEKNDAEKLDFNMSDDDDYGAPASVGPALPEEQMADETYEQFEERILSKRTIHMLHIINGKLDRDNSILFADVVRNNKRKQVAQKFYTFLVLKKQQAVELEQSESYGDLIITRGPKFDAVYNSN